MEKNFIIKMDGYNISCKIYCDKIREVKKAVIFGHGFGGHKDNKAAMRFANRVLDKNSGVAIITFNWPCHGDDMHKVLRLEDCMTYLDNVIAYANEQMKADELYAYATSFGGYLFLKYIGERENPFVKIAFRCPAVKMYDVITASIVKGDEYESIMSGKPALVGFDRKIKIDKEFLDELKESDITENDYIDYADDILILQGTLDELVPMQMVREFADDNLIDFVPVERADHRFTDLNTMILAISEIIKFFGMR